MVRKFNKKHGYWYHEGPYTDEELHEFWAMDWTPVAFTRPGPVTPAAPDKPQDPPAKRSSPRPKRGTSR
jgi:hypothetical protein